MNLWVTIGAYFLHFLAKLGYLDDMNCPIEIHDFLDTVR